MGDNFFNSNRTVIIGELSCNHIQHFDIAVKTIEAMKDSGVDVVKVQNDKADGGITINCDNKYFQIKGGTLWDGETLYSLYKKTDTPWEWLPKLQELSHSLGMGFFSSPSDPSGIDFLEELKVPAYKIASFEITDIPLIEKAARTGKPIIISTGIADEGDIQLAVDTCRSCGNNNILLMKCVSSYPAQIDKINLSALSTLKEKFKCKVGLSDHSMGDIVATTAVALGAEMVEKHFILDRRLGGPDSAFSMEPDEFRLMVDRIRDVEKCLGKKEYYLNEEGISSKRFAKSLFVVSHVKAGDIVTCDNVRAIRPGDGMHPKYLKEMLGRKFIKDVEIGTPFTIEMVL